MKKILILLIAAMALQSAHGAEAKITELDELTAPVEGDWLAAVDVSDTGQGADGSTKKTSLKNARDLVGLDFTTVASATTTDIGAVASPRVQITGTTTITGLGTSGIGLTKWVLFSGILTLTYNGTSLIIPGAASITTAAGDFMLVVSLGSGNWRVVAYTRASGQGLIAYAPLADPEFTGDPKAPTPADADDDTSIATTEMVQNVAALKAPLASPTFTGTPAAPTPAAGDNDTSVATTEHVATAVRATATGSHASPDANGSVTPTWDGPLHVVWSGATQTINLPAASGYTGKAITIYNTGAFTITIEPNASEVIVRDGNVQTGGVNCTLSSGAGNFAHFYCDGTRWISMGRNGTLAVGT